MTYKSCRCLPVLLLLLCCLFFSSVRADSDALSVQTSTSSQIVDGETIQTLVVRLFNTSNQPIRNLCLSNLLPPELTYSSAQSAGLLIDEIPANGSAQTVFSMRPLRHTAVQTVAQNTLHITIEGDQQAYQRGQSAKVTVTVENLTDQTLSDVQIRHLFPDELGLSDSSASDTLLLPVLQAYGVYQYDVFIRRLSDSPGQALYVAATLNHDAYRKGDIAKLTVRITNESDTDAVNVTLGNLLPNGFQYAAAQKQTSFTYPRIKAGESVEETLLVEIIDTSFLPQTGDRPIWPALALGIANVLLLARLFIHKKTLED